MTKNNKRRVLACLLLVCVLLGCTGCGEADDAEGEQLKSITVTLTVDYPKSSNYPDIRDVSFRLEEDTSVLQAIELYGNVNNIPVVVNTTDSTLVGIQDIYDHVYKSNMAWTFTINGKRVSKSEANQMLKDGDVLTFIYTKQ